jgi:hypothetical protein
VLERNIVSCLQAVGAAGWIAHTYQASPKFIAPRQIGLTLMLACCASSLCLALRLFGGGAGLKRDMFAIDDVD